MMQYVQCPMCKHPEVRVPAGHICFDCAYPSPQQRQAGADRMRMELEDARVSLRDQFAMAAMAALPIVKAGPTSTSLAREAYAIVDAMMAARLPVSV